MSKLAIGILPNPITIKEKHKASVTYTHLVVSKYLSNKTYAICLYNSINDLKNSKVFPITVNVVGVSDKLPKNQLVIDDSTIGHKTAIKELTHAGFLTKLVHHLSENYDSFPVYTVNYRTIKYKIITIK